MIKCVRNEIKFGSDWIKILVTGAFMAYNNDNQNKDSPEITHFSENEIKAVVNEAKRRNINVMAHAHGADGIYLAAENGCRSIEHASFIDERGIQSCLKNNTWIVPTFLVGEYYEENGSKSGYQDRMIELLKETNTKHINCIRNAIKSGVKVALGSDYVGWDPKINAREFYYLVEKAGLTSEQAIYAGTCSAADMLEKSNIGRIKIGCNADIVIILGNPLNDITLLEKNVCFVMKEGQIIRNDLNLNLN